MNQERLFVWNSHWKQLGIRKLHGSGSQVGGTVLAQLTETWIWHWPAGFVGRGLCKGVTASVNTSVQEKAVPPAFVLKPDNSVPPHLFLAPFQHFPQQWSSGSVRVRQCASPLREKPRSPGVLLSHSAIVSTGFTARRYGDFYFCHWNPGLGVLIGTWGTDLDWDLFS